MHLPSLACSASAVYECVIFKGLRPPAAGPPEEEGHEDTRPRGYEATGLEPRPPGGLLGASGGLLGASWGPLGGLLGASWGPLGASWARLVASWARPGASWGFLGSSWMPPGGVLGASWGLLGASGASLGPPGEAPGGSGARKYRKNHVFSRILQGFRGGPGTPQNLGERLRGGNLTCFGPGGGDYRRGGQSLDSS